MKVRHTPAAVFLPLFLLGTLAAATLRAAPFATTIRFEQPDGAVVELWGKGDEFHAVFETLDGYTVVFNQTTKAYEYAGLSADGNDLVTTGLRVGQSLPAQAGLPRHLRINPEAVREKARQRRLRWEAGMQVEPRWSELKTFRRNLDRQAAGEPVLLAPPSFTTTGTKVGLCLLIDFDDDPATIPQAEVVQFCNGDSYTGYGNNGSIKQYFQDNSGGLLTYSNVVTVYIRIPNSLHPKSWYNDTSKDCGSQANLLIRDAIAVMTNLPNYATEILPTFNNLTVDGANQVVACNVFYAGGNGGVWNYGLWPHSWSLYNVGAQPLSAGGKKVYRYQVTNIGSSLSIGTFCHENGHMLCGFPDIYDYGYDSEGGAGKFCLMNSGNFDYNPVQINAYLKRAAGWATTLALSSTSNLTATLTSSAGPAFNRFYRYAKPGSSTEYFLLENRQKSGRDANLPAAGIAIWHVDELGDHDNQSTNYNTTHANYELTLMPADNLWHFQQNSNDGDAQDLFYLGNPATAYSNRFSDTSQPNARWWDGSNAGLNFHSFSASGTQMTFVVGSIPVSEQIRLAGDLAFGPVPAGQSARRIMTLFNSADAAFSITNIVYPAGFSGAWTGTLAAYGTRDIPITFVPTNAGGYGPTLTLQVAASNGTVSRSLSGTGMVGLLSLIVTNPPGPVPVSNAVTSYDVRGTAGAALTGLLRWTNALTGGSGTAAAQTNWLIASVALGVGSNAITVTASNSPSGSLWASDSAASAPYVDGWTTGDNGGSGFQEWILATNGAQAGHFRATTANANLNSGAEAWGLWANSGSEANAYRPLGRPLQPGDTFRLTFENNWIANGASVGVSLLNPDGEYLVEFFFTGGGSSYTLQDATPNRDTGLAYTDQGLNLAITLLTSNTYQLVAGAQTLTGTLAPRTDMTPTRFRAWNYSAGTGEGYNFYFNALSATTAPAVVTFTSVTARITRLGIPPTVDPIPAQTATVGQVLSYTVTASNPENDAMTFACSSAVASNTWSLDGASGLFQYTPLLAHTGLVSFSFTASDRDGTSSPVRLDATVLPAPTAPIFDPLGVQTARTLAATSFVVSASGYPAPVLALEATTASAGYSFTPASGLLSYTPPYADAGTRTFTFTARNSAGAATQQVDVIVSLASPLAPLAIWASFTNATDFTAAWSPAGGASGYRLDVHTHPSFGGLQPGVQWVEHFSTLGAGSGTFTTRVWTNNGIVWTGYLASTDRVIDGTALALDDAPGAYFVSSPIPGGLTNLSIAAMRANGRPTTFDLFVNTTKVLNAVTPATSATTTTVGGLNFSGAITLLVSNRTGNVVWFDNLSWTGQPIPGGDPVPGYSNRAVGGTSQQVTGLVPVTTYYLRVRATNSAGESAYSPTGSVTTLAPSTNNVINFAPIPDQVITNSVGLAATASSGLPVSFSLSSGPALLQEGTNLSFNGTGLVTIVASQGGDETWPPAQAVTQSFHVIKAPALVLLSDLLHVYDGTTKTASVSTVPTGLTVLVVYDAVPLQAGSYGVTATLKEANYEGAATGTLEVARAPQAITFDPVPDQLVTNVVVLSALASSGLPVSFSVTNGPALLQAGATLTFHAAGWVTVLAGQAGDTNWMAAAPVTNTFLVRLFADVNTNGTPDEWELTYFGNLTNVTAASDFDRDGKLDWEEYVANTDPTNSRSYQAIGVSPGGSSNALALAFNTATGRLYRLEFTTNLWMPDWQPLFTNLPGTGEPVVWAETNGASSRYYRQSVFLIP